MGKDGRVAPAVGPTTSASPVANGFRPHAQPTRWPYQVPVSAAPAARAESCSTRGASCRDRPRRTAAQSAGREVGGGASARSSLRLERAELLGTSGGQCDAAHSIVTQEELVHTLARGLAVANRLNRVVCGGREFLGDRVQLGRHCAARAAPRSLKFYHRNLVAACAFQGGCEVIQAAQRREASRRNWWRALDSSNWGTASERMGRPKRCYWTVCRGDCDAERCEHERVISGERHRLGRQIKKAAATLLPKSTHGLGILCVVTRVFASLRGHNACHAIDTLVPAQRVRIAVLGSSTCSITCGSMGIDTL